MQIISNLGRLQNAPTKIPQTWHNNPTRKTTQ